jgi:hypothetical protein
MTTTRPDLWDVGTFDDEHGWAYPGRKRAVAQAKYLFWDNHRQQMISWGVAEASAPIGPFLDPLNSLADLSREVFTKFPTFKMPVRRER